MKTSGGAFAAPDSRGPECTQPHLRQASRGGGRKVSWCCSAHRWAIQRPTVRVGRQGSADRKGDVISDSVSLQGPVQFPVLGNRNQRITGEGVWEAGRECRVPGPSGSSGGTVTERRHKEVGHMRNTFLQHVLGCRASFKRKNCSVPWLWLLRVSALHGLPELKPGLLLSPT